MSVRGIPFFCVAALMAGLALAGCDIPNGGIAPARATLNFPIALGLTAPATATGSSDFLLVVNSNYDARYNQGSIFSLDMGVIERRFASVRDAGRYQEGNGVVCTDPAACGCSNPASWDDPNVECQIGEVADYMVGGQLHTGAEVWIDSFAAGIVRSPQGDRFYLPVRSGRDENGSRPGVTWIDVNPTTGVISCAEAPGSLACGTSRRTTPVQTGCAGRDMTLTGDPTSLVAMRLDTLTGRTEDVGRDVVMTIQRNGTAALYLDQGVGAMRVPTLTHVLTGMAPDAINSALEPSSGLAWVSTSSPVSSRATRSLGRVGVFIDPDLEACSQAFSAPGVFLDGLATGFDTRDVAFGSDPRYAYVLSRSPESVITIDQDGTPFIPGNAAIVDVDDVGFGPSRMRVVHLGGRDFLVVTAFDGRAVWILRTDPTEVVSVVPGFDGAYEMVIDEARQLAIVADFRTSVLRFVDLSPLVTGHQAVVLGRIGTPRTRMGFP